MIFNYDLKVVSVITEGVSYLGTHNSKMCYELQWNNKIFGNMKLPRLVSDLNGPKPVTERDKEENAALDTSCEHLETVSVVIVFRVLTPTITPE